MIEKITVRCSSLALLPLPPIRSELDYDNAVTALNQLLDAGAADEQHALADLATMLGTLIAAYDESHYPATLVSAVNLLRFLMEQHQLPASALPELGTQADVYGILSGTCKLAPRQIKALAARFQVPATLFL